MLRGVGHLTSFINYKLFKPGPTKVNVTLSVAATTAGRTEIRRKKLLRTLISISRLFSMKVTFFERMVIETL
ncbi:hypothetical protein TYRP_015310 [Tyrophagus putrescentiae]|nr:hypothetical protein TYRP_015310 [Tyrophagus putrescentiae]